MVITFELNAEEQKVLSILKEQGASFRGVSEVYFYGFGEVIKKFEKAGLVKKDYSGTHDLGNEYRLTSLGCSVVESTTITL